MKEYGIIKWKIDHVEVLVNNGVQDKRSETNEGRAPIPKSMHPPDTHEKVT
jgi:hypothetical protein